MLSGFEQVKTQELRGMSRDEFDHLPFGAILLDRDGNIHAYNQWESRMSRRSPEQVVGRNFFTDVAPCTNVEAFRGQLDSMRPEIRNTHVFDYHFNFPWGRRAVRIRFLVESMDARWVFVTDLT
jgi:photoactive yellow protein